MARNLFKAEFGFGIRDENSDIGVDLINGAGAPPGTSGISDTAGIGSVWYDRTNGILYIKQADTSSATDWVRLVGESLYTALGITYGDTDMGTYTGNLLPDNSDQKTINQILEAAIEVAQYSASVSVPAATPTTIGTVLVDDYNYIEYEVVVYENANETNKEGFKFTILHDGTTSSDATDAGTDNSVHTKLKSTGKVDGLVVDHVLSGTGAAQTIGLQITTTNASTVKVRRNAVPL